MTVGVERFSCRETAAEAAGSAEFADELPPILNAINGKAPTAHIIEPDIGALLDDYREHGDPGLLYVARLSFP